MVESGVIEFPERPIIAAALVRSAEVEAAMRGALADHPQTQLRAKFAEATDLASLRELRGDVILVDLDAGSPSELEILAQFLAEGAHAPVVVTSPWLDVASMCELMRIGVQHIVPQPLNGGELLGVLQRALARRHESPSAPARGQRKGTVVSYMGSGGGVGATSLAVHGACALSRRRSGKGVRSAGPRDICLIDLNIQFGGAALLLDADQRSSSILDLIDSADRLDGELLRGAMTAAGGLFDLLASPAEFTGVDDIDPDGVAAVIDIAASEYAVTILDVPLLWSHWTHAALRESDAIVLVVQPTVPSLQQARRQIAMLRQEELDDIPVTVVANRVGVGPLSNSAVTLKAAEAALGRKIDHVIPETPAVRAAAEVGNPLGEVRGGSAVDRKILACLEQAAGLGSDAAGRRLPRWLPSRLAMPRWLLARPMALVFGQ
jgi:pilus assembly protein CpaE